MNIVEQGISALEAAIKADISRPDDVKVQMNNRDEARRQGIPTGPLLNSAAAASVITKCGSSNPCEMSTVVSVHADVHAPLSKYTFTEQKMVFFSKC